MIRKHQAMSSASFTCDKPRFRRNSTTDLNKKLSDFRYACSNNVNFSHKNAFEEDWSDTDSCFSSTQGDRIKPSYEFLKEFNL